MRCFHSNTILIALLFAMLMGPLRCVTAALDYGSSQEQPFEEKEEAEKELLESLKELQEVVATHDTVYGYQLLTRCEWHVLVFHFDDLTPCDLHGPHLSRAPPVLA